MKRRTVNEVTAWPAIRRTRSPYASCVLYTILLQSDAGGLGVDYNKMREVPHAIHWVLPDDHVGFLH